MKLYGIGITIELITKKYKVCKRMFEHRYQIFNHTFKITKFTKKLTPAIRDFVNIINAEILP